MGCNYSAHLRRKNRIEIRSGKSVDQVPGKKIVISSEPSMISDKNMRRDFLRSYLKNDLKYNIITTSGRINRELEYLAREIKSDLKTIKDLLESNETIT